MFAQRRLKMRVPMKVFFGLTCPKARFLPLRLIASKSPPLHAKYHSELLDNYEPAHDKTDRMVYAPSEDEDQLGHPPSMIRVFAVRSLGS